jgi:hypothetical protein
VAKHAAGMEEIIGYQGRRADLTIILISIIDDFDCGHDCAYVVRDGRDGEGWGCQVQVVRD